MSTTSPASNEEVQPTVNDLVDLRVVQVSNQFLHATEKNSTELKPFDTEKHKADDLDEFCLWLYGVYEESEIELM